MLAKVRSIRTTRIRIRFRFRICLAKLKMVKLCSFAALLAASSVSLSLALMLCLRCHFKLVITRKCLPTHTHTHIHCLLTYAGAVFAYCLPRHNAKMRVTSFLKPNINSGICTAYVCVYECVCIMTMFVYQHTNPLSAQLLLFFLLFSFCGRNCIHFLVENWKLPRRIYMKREKSYLI